MTALPKETERPHADDKAGGRKQLADAVYRTRAVSSRREAHELVDQLLSEIVDALKQDGKVSLSGFGVFKSAAKAERVGRNPGTGEEHVVSARRAVRFRASDLLQKRVEAGCERAPGTNGPPCG